jgi:hypothetical protein
MKRKRRFIFLILIPGFFFDPATAAALMMTQPTASLSLDVNNRFGAEALAPLLGVFGLSGRFNRQATILLDRAAAERLQGLLRHPIIEAFARDKTVKYEYTLPDVVLLLTHTKKDLPQYASDIDLLISVLTMPADWFTVRGVAASRRLAPMLSEMDATTLKLLTNLSSKRWTTGVRMGITERTIGGFGQSGPAAGALAIWEPLLKWFGSFVTMGIAAIGEGTAIGLAAWHSHGHVAAAIVTIGLMISVKLFNGTLQPSPRGRWRGMNFRDPEFSGSYFSGSVLTQLSSTVSFVPAYLGLPMVNVFVAAIVPHLMLNLWSAWHVWNTKPSKRFLLFQLQPNEEASRPSYGLKIAHELEKDVVVETDKLGNKWLHRLQVAYLPRRMTWEINVSPMDGYMQSFLVRALEKIHLHGPRSGRIIYRFNYNPKGSSLHLLTGSRIETEFEDHGIYHEVVKKIIEQVPESALIWHDLNEIKTLRGLYDALDEQWKTGYPLEARDLEKLWKDEGKRKDQIVSGFRQIVHAAYFYHQRHSTAPLIPPSILESLKLPKTLIGKQTTYVDIIAESGGGLWLRTFKGTRDMHMEPWHEAPDWLVSFWKSEGYQGLRLSTEKAEQLMRRWEVSFAMRYEERMANWPPVELMEMTRYAMIHRHIDTMAVDRFLIELPASEHAGLTDPEILSRFGEYLAQYKVSVALREGWDPYLDDLPELGETYSTQSYEGKPIALSRIQAYWAAELLRSDSEFTLKELMMALSEMRQKQQRILEDYQRRDQEIQRSHNKIGDQLFFLQVDKEKSLKAARKAAISGLLQRHSEQGRSWAVPRVIGFLTDSPSSRIHDAMYDWLKEHYSAEGELSQRKYFEVVLNSFKAAERPLKINWLDRLMYLYSDKPPRRARSKVEPWTRVQIRRELQLLFVNYLPFFFPGVEFHEPSDSDASTPPAPQGPLQTAA